MLCSSINILPDGDLFVQTGEDLTHTDFLAHTSIATFLKSHDYDIIQIFEHDSNLPKNVESTIKVIEYFKNPNNHRYYIIYSVNYPDRCWKVWDVDISKLYKIVCGDGEPTIFKRLPFHSDYYKVTIEDYILFHKKEQMDLRDIKLTRILE